VSRLPHAQGENCDLGGERTEVEQPGDAPVLVDALELGGGEVRARIEARQREVRNLGSPEENPRRNPACGGGEHGQALR
jgi:hypothetical protein